MPLANITIHALYFVNKYKINIDTSSKDKSCDQTLCYMFHPIQLSRKILIYENIDIMVANVEKINSYILERDVNKLVKGLVDLMTKRRKDFHKFAHDLEVVKTSVHQMNVTTVPSCCQQGNVQKRNNYQQLNVVLRTNYMFLRKHIHSLSRTQKIIIQSQFL
ncbi:uncharacterized protein LOC130630457 [Hydractinia symbiolongicarpus]|uniref:uncharacterized protein LOC130630457 n=1 Tax=Hydractinia symbiolongicarpus TaxID=13093 RepID=UPI00254BC77A|nr:uncharacterized protein LOC130630457 [Hydractinia symbiolongicarpus]